MDAPTPESPLRSLLPEGRTFLDLSLEEQTSLVHGWRKDRIFRVRVKKEIKTKKPKKQEETTPEKEDL